MVMQSMVFWEKKHYLIARQVNWTGQNILAMLSTELVFFLSQSDFQKRNIHFLFYFIFFFAAKGFEMDLWLSLGIFILK